MYLPIDPRFFQDASMFASTVFGFPSPTNSTANELLALRPILCSAPKSASKDRSNILSCPLVNSTTSRAMIRQLGSTEIIADEWTPKKDEPATWTMKQSMGIQLMELTEDHLQLQGDFILSLYEALISRTKYIEVGCKNYTLHYCIDLFSSL
jgi:hypothetical protein